MILANLTLILFNITNAFIDASRIKHNKVIRHGINGALYLAVVLFFILVCRMNLAWAITYTVSAFLSRQITFDIPLNLLRKLKWDYVSLDRPPKAILDRLEVKIFGYNGRLTTLIYGSFWAVSLIIQYFIHA